MRHRKSRTKLGRTSAHRRAMLANMVAALIEHGRLKTTESKAREVRRAAERVISRATRLGDILTKDWEQLDAEERGRLVHAVRLVRRVVKRRDLALRVFNDWGPRYLGRPGGYTRMFKLGNRRGDNAPTALLEFVPAEASAADDGGEEQAQPAKKRGSLLSRRKQA